MLNTHSPATHLNTPIHREGAAPRVGVCNFTADLAKAVHQRTITMLVSKGNIIPAGSNHDQAVKTLALYLAQLATGTIRGRFAYGGPCGIGKTTAIVALCAVLAERGLLGKYSVSVAATRIEDLCELYRNLETAGVPSSSIGLWHTYKPLPEDLEVELRHQSTTTHRPFSELVHQHNRINGTSFASLASVPQDRPIALVSHNQVHRGREQEMFLNHLDKPRNVMVYDESLIRASSVSVSLTKLELALTVMRTLLRQSNPDVAEVLEYMTVAFKRLDKARVAYTKAAKAKRRSARKRRNSIVALDPIFEGQHERWLKAFQRRRKDGHIEEAKRVYLDLYRLAGTRVRVVPSQGGRFLARYDITLADELENMLILDASYNTRTLCKLDTKVISIQDHIEQQLAAKYGKDWARHKDPFQLWRTKDFSDMVIHHMDAPGGRGSATDNFTHKKGSSYLKALVQVVQDIPDDEAILVFTFKRRGKHDFDCVEAAKEYLRAGGVDLDSQVTIEGKTRPRLSFLTYGQETGTNGYAYCSNVILMGTFYKPAEAVAGEALGHLDNLEADMDDAAVNELVLTETLHVIHQAASRGSCRVIRNGRALPMKLWLVYHERTSPLRRLLVGDRKRPNDVHAFPGARWETWEEPDSVLTAVATHAKAIAAKLSEYQRDGEHRVSTRKLKSALGITDLHSKTFAAALERAFRAVPGWDKDAKSVVFDPEEYQFAVEPFETTAGYDNIHGNAVHEADF